MHGQQDIYYACGDSYEKIAKLPQIEKAKDKGYEILFFKDGVDEFVAKILIDFEGKKFKSINDADFSLDSEEEKKEYEVKLPDVEEYEKEQKLAFEKEVLGVYITGHPLEEYESRWRKNISAFSRRDRLRHVARWASRSVAKPIARRGEAHREARRSLPPCLAKPASRGFIVNAVSLYPPYREGRLSA